MTDKIELPDLLPCPFCGAEAFFNCYPDEDTEIGVECSTCCAVSRDDCRTHEEAAGFWNRRSPAIAAKRAPMSLTDEWVQEVMFAVFDYASIADGIEKVTFERRDQQRAKMFAQDRKIRGMLRALLADASLHIANAPQVPDGWKVVPVAPTPKMVKAGALARHSAACDGGYSYVGSSAADWLCAKAAYSAMLSAAPQPEQKG